MTVRLRVRTVSAAPRGSLQGWRCYGEIGTKKRKRKDESKFVMVMKRMLWIKETSIDNPDAKVLISELNHVLVQITGDDGTTSFHAEDVKTEKSSFLIAYLDGVPYGCGALRRVSDDTAEIKRVYARRNKAGVGRAILLRLEERAIELGYAKLLLETRKQNKHAIQFYTLYGYVPCSAYGSYQGKENAYCFEKELTK